MEKLSVDDVESDGMGAADRRGLSEPLNTSDLAINYYHLQPGEGFSGGLHAHMDQEELFFVIDGEATFELPDETVTVGEREAIERDTRVDVGTGADEYSLALVIVHVDGDKLLAEEVGRDHVVHPCRLEQNVTRVLGPGVAVDCFAAPNPVESRIAAGSLDARKRLDHPLADGPVLVSGHHPLGIASVEVDPDAEFGAPSAVGFRCRPVDVS